MANEAGSTLRERLSDLERVATDFEKRLQLDKIKIQEVDLEINAETISKMDPIDINIMCMEWCYYSLGIQKEINAINARLSWADSILDRYLCEQSVNYPGYGFNERKSAVLANDSYALKLAEFKDKCKMIVDRNTFLTSKIDFLCKLGQNIAYAKRGEKNEG
jgi:hypothetical protein